MESLKHDGVTGPNTRSRRNRPVRTIAATGILLASLWVIWDLFGPHSADIRQFDPDEVARLETAMWRSYYDRQPLHLFLQLAVLMRTQFHLPFLRSNLAAYKAARAAFIFKDGHNHSDYERAFPSLLDLYREIRRVSRTDVDVQRAARLELEWWIVHRERSQHAPVDLERALAELAAELYRIPANQLMEHARLRAEAMLLRDARDAAGGASEEDWLQIGRLLQQSYRSLSRALAGVVNNAARTRRMRPILETIPTCQIAAQRN